MRNNFEAMPSKVEEPMEKPKDKASEKLESKEQEKHLERIEMATMALRDYLALKPDERVLIIEDADSKAELVSIMKEALTNKRVNFETFFLDDNKTKEQLHDKLKDRKVILDTSQLMDTHKSTFDLYENDLNTYRARLIAFCDLGETAFDKDGAMVENMAEMNERMNKMEAELSKAKGFHITSIYGTDLYIGIRPWGDRSWSKVNGVVAKDGKWDNWPGGEIFTTPDEGNVNGILVVPSDSSIENKQGVDELVRLTIKNGCIVEIQGGRSARILREQLEKDAKKWTKGKENKDKNPWDSFRMAEIAFGANSKAKDTVANPGKSYKRHATSVVEAEKRLGTMHIAFGSAKHGEEEADGIESAQNHYDFVLPRHGLTVEMFTNEDDFRSKKSNNTQKIINGGSFNLA